MMFIKNIYFICLITITAVISQNVNITIPLNKILTPLDKELFGEYYTIEKNSTVEVTLTNWTKTIDYIIFQVHTHIYNVTLYNNTLLRGSYVTGTNIGLYGTLNPPDVYYIMNQNEIDLKMYISVHGYKNMDPIPGGCNMEFPVKISPFMRVAYTKDSISVDVTAAKDINDTKCLGFQATVNIYRMYLYEREFDEKSYFDGLKKMLTLGAIRENGDLMPDTLPYHRQRRLLSAYPGTGSIYVAVASINDDKYYAIYVPTHTYACSTLDGCDLLDDITSQFLCACLVFIGLFICFLGHRFFTTEMFIMGMFAGVLTTYILIALWTDLERPALLGASVLSGVFFGAIWLLFWWFYGIPVVAVALATMHLGYIVAALIYFGASDHVLLRSDSAFWSFFILFMLCLCITLTTVTFISNILCCAVLGAYTVVFAVDYYIGSNLKYILINTIRRAVVEKFNYAIIAPPFQWRDIIASLVWVSLAMLGFLWQDYHSRGRPPFPPPSRLVSRATGAGLSYGAVATTDARSRRRTNSSNPASTPTYGFPQSNERTPLLGAEEIL